MRALFVHFRSAPERGRMGAADPEHSAGTDGVSLEMMKRERVLREMRHEVAICSALPHASFAVPGLEFESEAVKRLQRNLFGDRISNFSDERALSEAFRSMTDSLYAELRRVFDAYRPDLALVHNMFCLPVHPAATVALARVFNETGVPCSATHHDVLSEGAYKFRPTCAFVWDLLRQHFPPIEPWMRHSTINTRNQRALRKQGIDAQLIHDTMDFDETWDPEARSALRAELRPKYGIQEGDVVLFTAARIVPNKQLEIAGRLARAVSDRKEALAGKLLYHGRVFPGDGRVVLVLAGRPERDFKEYRDRLFALLDELKVDWKYAGDDVRPVRDPAHGKYALYPDMYAVADFVLYPSVWEGFGNQLLEAMCVRLPITVFEYPVFKEDIATKGTRVVSLGDRVLEERDRHDLVRIPEEILERATGEIVSMLTDARAYARTVETNFDVGKRNFSFDVLRTHLKEVVAWARGRGRAG